MGMYRVLRSFQSEQGEMDRVSRLQQHAMIVPLVVTTTPATIVILNNWSWSKIAQFTYNEQNNISVIVDDKFDDELSWKKIITKTKLLSLWSKKSPSIIN